jgi:hypothetical protein
MAAAHAKQIAMQIQATVVSQVGAMAIRGRRPGCSRREARRHARTQ